MKNGPNSLEPYNYYKQKAVAQDGEDMLTCISVTMQMPMATLDF